MCAVTDPFIDLFVGACADMRADVIINPFIDGHYAVSAMSILSAGRPARRSR